MMSYSASRSLGTVDVWDYVWALHLVTTSDVMVLRLHVANARLEDASDALLFIRAAGQGQNWGLDVRGVAVSDVPGSTDKQVDIIFTRSDPDLLGIGFTPIVGVSDDAASMATQIAADESLRQTSPNLQITSAQIGVLTAPADAIDHWRSQPIAWDHLLSGPKNRGGPTDTFAKPADYTVVKGTADDGKRATPWKLSVLDYGRQKIGELSSTQLALLAGGAALLGVIGYQAYENRRSRS